MTRKTKRSEMFGFAATMGGINIMQTILAMFLNAYYTDTVGIAAAAIGTMMLVLRVFDGVTDLIMGAIIDKTHTRFGKAKPWVMISIPFLFIATILLLNIPMNYNENGKLLYAYITYFFMSCIVCTVYQVSDNALLARITLDPQERQTMSSVAQIISGLVALFVTSFTAGMVASWGWKKVSIFYGLAMCIIVLIGILLTKEHVDENLEEKKITVKPISLKEGIPAVLKNRYFINLAVIFVFQQMVAANSGASMVYYCRIVLGNMGAMAVLGMAASIPQMLINFVLPFFVSRFSKQKCQIGAAVVMIIGFGLCGMAGQNFMLALAGTCLRSAAIGVFFACSYAFAADVVDYGEYKTGLRTDGLVNSGVSFGLKVGVGFGSALISWVLAAGGYVGTAEVQTVSAVTAVKFGFGYVNMIISICLLITVLFMNVEKMQEEIRKNMKERHEA